MSSITALMASLPPPSLAETDLARFAAQALGRRSRAELPGLAALFGEETLFGYPPSIGPIMRALCETIVQQGIEPQALDARTVDALLGSTAFLARLEASVSVERQRLRPGTVIGAALRQTLGTRLLVLPGVGRELVLIAPVDLAQVADAHFAVPLGIVLARPAPPEEAEVLRASWAVIEERFGLDGDEARLWEARFVAISRRENHDAEGAAAGLSEIDEAQRLVLWEVLIEHLRDGELPEQHRSGRRGLERRLGELGFARFGAIPPWVEATLTLVESVYRAAGLDPEVMAGRAPAPPEDVARWCGWVDVAAAMRERVKKLPSETIEHLLVRLSEEEAGRVERRADTMPEPLARALASLRDQCLRPRWQRSRWALVGIDPLALARARVASGEDSHAIRKALEALSQEAAKAERKASRPAPRTRTQAPRLDATPDAAPSEDAAPTETTAVPAPTPESTPARSPAPAAAPTADAGGLRPPRFHLPPLPPVPPPRPAPRVRPRTDFPPMPAAPPRTADRSPDKPAEPAATAPRPPMARVPSQRLPSQRLPSQRLPSQRVPTARLSSPATERAAPAAPSAPAPPPRAARPRTGTAAPHLVTPSQGNDFYDASFRELELIERDLLQRGPYAGAAERIQAIAAEADELHAALGPSARSGDREFQSAQRRIEKVQAYLERIRPLLAPRSTLTAEPPPSASGGTGLLARLFGRRR